MRLLISRLHGQIARALADEALSSHDVQAFAIGRPALDVRDPRSIERAFADVNPDLGLGPKQLSPAAGTCAAELRSRSSYVTLRASESEPQHCDIGLTSVQARFRRRLFLRFTDKYGSGQFPGLISERRVVGLEVLTKHRSWTGV
jgi:hypothetical protein